MLTFIRGSGIEFLVPTDQDNIRKAFIDGLVKDNRLKTRVKRLAIKMMKRGRVLLYLRPIKRGYRIYDYTPDQYRADYDGYDDLQAVTVVYSYKVRQPGTPIPRDRWVRLRITAALVEKWESDTKLDFDQTPPPTAQWNATENRLGQIPCIEILNPAPGTEEEGVSDFAALGSKIEAHDDLVTSIIDNLYFFSNSPLVTNRDAGEVSDQLGLGSSGMRDQDSVSWQSDYRATSDPFINAGGGGRGSRRDRLRRLKKVIGGFEPEDQLQQLQINAVPGDLLSFADQYERQLRESLGGILERGIETATESRVVYGKVMSTAAEKQAALFDHGLCPLLEMAILAEEALFTATGGAQGLPELGDRTVTWRMGEVYQPTPESLNFRSITARNLAKFFGVSPRAAIQYVFPEKSENEIDSMVGDGGFPSDYLQTAIAMFAQLAQTQDPLTGLPISDVNGVPLCEKLKPFLEKGLDYGAQFNQIEPVDRRAIERMSAALTAALGYAQRQQLQSVNPSEGTEEDEPLPSPGTVTAPRGGGFFDFSQSPILNGIRSLFGGV